MVSLHQDFGNFTIQLSLLINTVSVNPIIPMLSISIVFNTDMGMEVSDMVNLSGKNIQKCELKIGNCSNNQAPRYNTINQCHTEYVV